MGYDMEWVDVPAEKLLEVEQLWHQIRDLGHGHPEAGGLWEKMDEVRDYYFRVNMWGMGTLRQIMKRAGMVDLNYNHSPFDADRPLENEVIIREYDVEVGLPPIYKFGSNDGWVVGPEEIAKALEIWDALEEMKQREVVVLATAQQDGDEDWFGWFTRWVDYWRAAKDHGGFSVD